MKKKDEFRSPEKDRKKAICQFCDTDFWGTDGPNGGKYTASELTDICFSLWPNDEIPPFIVFTGGEPLLQLSPPLIQMLKNRDCYLAVETNGTLPIPDQLDWVCVSPKAEAELVVKSGQELKVVYPQNLIDLDQLGKLDFQHFSLQPLDDPNQKIHEQSCLEYCLRNPQWRLSLQTHKMIGIP